MRVAATFLTFAISLFLTPPASVSAHDHEHMSRMKASEPLPGTSILI